MNPQRNIATRQNVCRTARLATFGFVVLAVSAFGQANDEVDVQITVTEAAARGPMIAVPMNQSVLVDFSVPISEVRIANPEIADVAVTTPRQILVDGKAFGSTQLIAVLESGEQRIFTVSVDLDLERLQSSIRSRVPRARVEASALLDTVVLSGTVADEASAERIEEIANIYAERVINHIQVAGVQQVLLRVTVAEVSRSATRQLGFNGWFAGENVRDMFFVNQLGGINPANIGAAADASVTAPVPIITGPDGIPLTTTPAISFGFPRVQMQVFIQALRENGLINVLAEPNLIAISGEKATFLAGGEFPIPVPQDNQSITIVFREFGVLLDFTPTVMSQNVIRLHVAPEISEPDFSTAVTLVGFTVPGLTERRVDTTVELGPGQTFAIGGLLSERSRAVSQKVPALGDIPILGPLFSSVEYQQAETELVVLVTPDLVAPLNPGQTPYIPAADYVPPNDYELFVEGKLYGDPNQVAKHDEFPAGPWPSRNPKFYGDSTVTKLRGPTGPATGTEGT